MASSRWSGRPSDALLTCIEEGHYEHRAVGRPTAKPRHETTDRDVRGPSSGSVVGFRRGPCHNPERARRPDRLERATTPRPARTADPARTTGAPIGHGSRNLDLGNQE